MFVASDECNSTELSKALGIPKARKVKGGATASASGIVPDVTGYDAPTAVKILERSGLNVSIKGTGRVVSQSLPKGSPLRHGDKITLNLKI